MSAPNEVARGAQPMNFAMTSFVWIIRCPSKWGRTLETMADSLRARQGMSEFA